MIRVTKPESQDEICYLAARFDRTRDFAGLVVHPPRERRRCRYILQRQNLEFGRGFNVGGGTDLYARLIARHFGKHISGNPTVIVRNMPGAGRAATTNYIFNVSPRDGSEIGLFAGNIAVDPVIGGVAVKYDARKFNWIGASASETAVCLASKATSFKTFDDVVPREMVIGAAGTGTYDFPVVLNKLGTKFKLVKGYNGSSGLRLALERGEIEGFCGVG